MAPANDIHLALKIMNEISFYSSSPHPPNYFLSRSNWFMVFQHISRSIFYSLNYIGNV
jgi:hypothetical protein